MATMEAEPLLSVPQALTFDLPAGEARVYFTCEPRLRERLVSYFEKIALTGRTPRTGPTGRARGRFGYRIDARVERDRERRAYEQVTGRKPRTIADRLRDDLGITDRARLTEAMRQWGTSGY